MQGQGNDFVVIDGVRQAVALTAAQVRRIADRHFGVGCDTVVLIRPGDAEVDASIQFYNADGKGFMAGNALWSHTFGAQGGAITAPVTLGRGLVPLPEFCSGLGSGIAVNTYSGGASNLTWLTMLWSLQPAC